MSRKKKSVTPVVIEAAQPERLNRRDKYILLIMTAVYALAAFLNLGTLCFPESAYTAGENEQITVRFSGEVEIETVYINTGIGEGTIIFCTETDEPVSYAADEGEMFQWKTYSPGFSPTDRLWLTVEEGLTVNEIAFLDADGLVLSCEAEGGLGAALFDEPDTVPEAPSYFNGMYFDEIYHARTAYEFLHTMSVYEWTHPPLGKLLIAVGIVIFGMNPFGWRFMGALFGVAMLPLMYIFAKRIFKRTDYALLAAGLLCVDCMHFTQTRIATIDVFAVFFIMLMFFFMYEFLRKPYMETSLREQLRSLLLCGISFGLGCSAKWIGCYAGAGLAVLLFYRLFGEYAAARREKRQQIFFKKTVSVLLHCCAFFVLIPGILYYLSYIPFYRYEASVYSDYSFKDTFTTLIQEQEGMYAYHSNLTATHLCQSSWYQWPLISKSVWFYVASVYNKISNISSTGNPAVWWVSAVLSVCLLLERIMKKIKADRELPVLFIGIAANYLPWMLVSRCVFLYHFFATLPFMILSGVYLLMHLEESNPRLRRVKWVWLAAALVYFILLFPAISGIPAGTAYAGFLENILPGGYLYYGWA